MKNKLSVDELKELCRVTEKEATEKMQEHIAPIMKEFNKSTGVTIGSFSFSFDEDMNCIGTKIRININDL